MILEPGQWQGRGSYRRTDESRGVVFRAQIDVSDAETRGREYLIHARLDDGRSLSVRVVADEFGTYAVRVRGLGIDAQGTAKLDSEPNLGLLWSEDGSVHIACALFVLPGTRGLRGFARIGRDTWTWELALQPLHRALQAGKDGNAGNAEKAGNVVSLADRRRR